MRNPKPLPRPSQCRLLSPLPLSAGRRRGNPSHTTSDDDYWYEDQVFFGFGSVHDLNSDDGPPPRLYGMRSVSKSAVWALHDEPETRKNPIGFRIPPIKRKKKR